MNVILWMVCNDGDDDAAIWLNSFYFILLLISTFTTIHFVFFCYAILLVLKGQFPMLICRGKVEPKTAKVLGPLMLTIRVQVIPNSIPPLGVTFED